MADRKKVFTMRPYLISKYIEKFERCAACSRFSKSVNKRKKIVESVDEANAFSLCFWKSIVLNDVLCWNCRIIARKNRKLDDVSQFPDNRGTFSESDNFSESNDKDPEFEIPIKYKVSEVVDHIRIQIQRTVATHKYCCVSEGNRYCRALLIKGRFFLWRIKSFTCIFEFRERKRFRAIRITWRFDCWMWYYEKDILPSRFGLNAISRRELIDSHTTDVSEMLFNSTDELMLICDGTCARHQKSNNNEYQWKSYSGQKKGSLMQNLLLSVQQPDEY